MAISPTGSIFPSWVLKPVVLPHSSMYRLATVYDLQMQGRIPGAVFTEWLKLNTPALTFDNDPALLKKYGELDDILSTDKRRIFDALPFYIKRDLENEDKFLKIYNSRDMMMRLATYTIRMLIGPGSIATKKDAASQGEARAVSQVRSSEQHFYDGILRCGGDKAALYEKVTYVQGLGPIENDDFVFGLANVHHLQSNAVLPRLGSVYHKVCIEGDVQYIKIILKYAAKRKHWKVLNKFYPYIDAKNKTKQTVSLAELVWHYAGAERGRQCGALIAGRKYTRLQIVNEVLSLFPVGSWNSTVCGYMSTRILLPSTYNLVSELRRIGIHKITNSGVVKLGKFLTMMYRRTRTWSNGEPMTVEDMLCCTYLNLLSGRAVKPVDWEQELANRRLTNKPVLPVYGSGTCMADWTPESGGSKDFVEASKPFMETMWRRMYGNGAGMESLEEASLRRRDWATNGSDRDKNLTVDGQRVMHVTKRLTIEEMSLKDMVEWLRQKPEEHAKGSEKGELGGARAILAPGLPHYIISTYSLDKLENRLFHLVGCEKGITGDSVIRNEVLRSRLLRATSMQTPYMADYADFNAQHTGEIERELHIQQAEVARQYRCHPDHIRAIKWHAESKLNKWLTLPGMGKERVSKGLFSGIRATDMTNTMMNQLYKCVPARDLVLQYPFLRDYMPKNYLDPFDPVGFRYRVQQGDDDCSFAPRS